MSKTKTRYADATMTPRKLGDFIPKGDGYSALATIEGVPVMVYSLDGPYTGQYGEYLVMAAIPVDDNASDGEDATLYRISGAIVPKLVEALEGGLEFPMLATFSKKQFANGRTGWVCE